MWRRVLRVSPAVVLTGLLLTGCGSDDEASGSDAVVPEGWTVVTDEPSGIEVGMPEAVDAQEQDAPTSDGGTMTARSYFTVADEVVELGFNVLDLSGGSYDLETGVQGVVDQIGGTVEDKQEITVDGHDAIQAEATFEGGVAVFQLIVLDDHVLQPLVASAEEDRDTAQEYFDQLTGSIDLG